jgi:hypothetical protein
MKTLICYKTKHGTTERYMRWLSERLDADLRSFEQIGRGFDFSPYETIVVSSGTYASFMPLTRFLKRNWSSLDGKEVVVVAVGAAPADDPWSLRSYQRIPERIRDKITYIKIAGEAPDKGRPEGYESPVKPENLDVVIEALFA